MRDFAVVFVDLILTLARLARPGGLRSVVAESVLVRHQLLILNRRRKRAPNLRATDRIIAGLCTLFLRPARVLRSAIVLKPSTLLHLQSVLRKRKYRMLFSQRPVRTSQEPFQRRRRTSGTSGYDWAPRCVQLVSIRNQMDSNAAISRQDLAAFIIDLCV